MSFVVASSHLAPGLLRVGLASLGLLALALPAAAQREDRITVTINRVTAVDKADIFGKADFYAKVTIAGDTQTTPVARQTNNIRPNWKISTRVPRGKHAIKIQMFDKDPGKPDDQIDINRVDNKRDLDFEINTASCRVSGFADSYSCGDTIVRTGNERKKAEIHFTVKVGR